ncbi:DUF2029 domain-containing protein [Subtercola sp. PAMC28395]|uniref:glycosyltransferase 87 family protein n=1 Tax=Subtercola sp. PAMC28395 TaxID=2846775 RepID=UPI001C0BD412|nr:glycosyltransferase 87 family protein [Subtercola sp. PAMC28395]QWT23844.1 DUF2029 domain-containing protein [Subtercola sp. PAMC28395]
MPKPAADVVVEGLRSTRSRALTVVLALVLVVMAAATALMVGTFGYFDPAAPAGTTAGATANGQGVVWVTAALWALFAAALVLVRKVPARTAIVLVLAGSAVLSGAALAGPPNTSTDSARYAWDGIVQNEGVSPYAYTPADDALAPFRTSWLFPQVVLDDEGHPQCEGPRIQRTISVPSFTVLCTAINRPQVHTIYPPVAELYFAGVRFVVDPSVEYWPFQVAGALISVAISGLLVLTMLRRRLNPRWAAIWAWSPFVAAEAVTNSHVDALAALLLLAATLLVARSALAEKERRASELDARGGSVSPPRPDAHRWQNFVRSWQVIAGGLLLGLAVAVKLVPVIGAPALLRRHSFAVAIPAVLAFVAVYIPYVAATGIAVIGFLPGYLSEEGYDDGSRFALLSIILPGPAALVIAAVILLVTAVQVWRRTDPANPWLGQVVMIGTTLLVVTPHYSWYALLLVPFIALSGRWEWLAVPAALTAGLLVPTLAVARVSFALAIAVVLAGLAYRTYRQRVYGRAVASAPVR